LALDYTMHDDLLIRTSFGSTKYCSHFLRGVDCTNKDCLYYHYIVDDKEIINNKDDNSVNSKRQTLALELGDVYTTEMKNKLQDKKSNLKGAVFPTVNTIYSKDFVIEHDYNKTSTGKQIHSSNSNSNLKTLLNRSDKSPKTKTTYKEDLNNLFSKKKKNLLKENLNENEISTSISGISRNTSSPNDDKNANLLHHKTISADLVIENNGHCKPPLFSNKEKSRFDFAKSSIEENTESVCIPKKINEIINKTTSTYYFLRNIELQTESYENVIRNNCDNDWVDFIMNLKANDSKK